MMTLARAVAIKELRDALRDRRSIAAAIMVTLAPPVVAAIAISRVGSGLGALAVFLLVSAFVTGMTLAIDITAGERERGSLEPLLLTGADSRAIAIGKWTATALFNLGGVCLTLACLMMVMAGLPAAPPAASMVRAAAIAFAAAVPLALAAAAVQVTIAVNAQSDKEGQTYLSMLLFVPMISGMLLEFGRARPGGWTLLVPIAAQHHAIGAAIRGENLTLASIAIPGAIALALTALFVHRAAMLLTRERIIFGR